MWHFSNRDFKNFLNNNTCFCSRLYSLFCTKTVNKISLSEVISSHRGKYFFQAFLWKSFRNNFFPLWFQSGYGADFKVNKNLKIALNCCLESYLYYFENRKQSRYVQKGLKYFLVTTYFVVMYRVSHRYVNKFGPNFENLKTTYAKK